MDPVKCLAGMNGQDIANIKSPQELVDRGMSKEDAIKYYTTFQQFKNNGVPPKLIEPMNTDILKIKQFLNTYIRIISNK